MSAALADAPGVGAVVGYVEAVTAAAVLGWVWMPGHAEPVDVELHLAGQVVARATADEMRDDLARNGIGAGRHAFTLATPEAAHARLAELRVFARTPAGAAVPLHQPGQADSVADRLTQMQRGLEMLVASQRVIHRNLQAALLTRAEESPPIVATQEALAQQIASLELFVTRLDERLAAAAAPAPRPNARRAIGWGVGAAFALSALALAVSVAGLIHALPR